MLRRMVEAAVDAASAPAADLIVHHGEIVTMNSTRDVLRDGAVAVAGQRIAAVGPSSELLARWPEATRLDARRCIVTPGMVNAHQHLTGDPLARSCIPDD